MVKDIFEIRGNISHTINRLEQMAREREEREKAEREAKWKREREEREREEAKWKAEHPVLDKFTYMSYTNWKTYSWPGDYLKIYFYEWSNLDSEPKFFPQSIAFYRFIDSSKINLTEEQNNKIKLNVGCHITCIPGTHDLLIGKSYEDLKSQFNMSRILSSVPNVPKVISCKVYDAPKNYA